MSFPLSQAEPEQDGFEEPAQPVLREGEKTLAFLLALRAQGVSDLNVLRAMEKVPRHDFAPARYSDLARTNVSIPLPCGQTMTPPSVVANLLVALAVAPGQRILEVGAGSGYVSALLVELGAQVVALERYRSLALAAYERLSGMGVRGVEMQHADGLNATRLLGRFDRIILNGVTGQIPEGLLQRLSPGGRLVGVVPVDGVTRLVSVRRTAENGSEQRHGPPIRLPPLAPGLAETL